MAIELSVDDLLTRLKTLIEPAGDLGLILTDEKFIENDDEFYNLFVGEATNRVAHGVLISYLGFTQREENQFCMIVSHKISVEFLYPYTAVPDGYGKNSHSRVKVNVTKVRQLLNLKVNKNLGFPTTAVTHNYLQSEVDWLVRKWGSSSASSTLSHYIPTDIVVTVREKRC